MQIEWFTALQMPTTNAKEAEIFTLFLAEPRA
jgi:hypothetical protein